MSRSPSEGDRSPLPPVGRLSVRPEADEVQKVIKWNVQEAEVLVDAGFLIELDAGAPVPVNRVDILGPEIEVVMTSSYPR